MELSYQLHWTNVGCPVLDQFRAVLEVSWDNLHSFREFLENLLEVLGGLGKHWRGSWGGGLGRLLARLGGTLEIISFRHDFQTFLNDFGAVLGAQGRANWSPRWIPNGSKGDLESARNALGRSSWRKKQSKIHIPKKQHHGYHFFRNLRAQEHGSREIRHSVPAKMDTL